MAPKPAISSLRLLRRSLALAGLLAGLMIPASSQALNKLNNWSFETAPGAGDWALQSTAAPPAKNFGNWGSGSSPTPELGTKIFRGEWTANGNGQLATGSITQPVTIGAPVNAFLRGSYQSTSSNAAVTAYTFSIDLFDSAAIPTSLINLVTINSTAAINDNNVWTRNSTAATPVSLPGGTFNLRAAWSVALDNNGNQGAFIDVLDLNVSPSGLSVNFVPGSTNMALSWTASAAGTGALGLRAANPYQVYRGVVASTTTPLAFSSGTGYTDTTTLGNSQYYYQVTDFDTGSGARLAEESPKSVVVGPVLTCPDVPTALTFTANSTSITANWLAPAGGADSYKVERSTSAAGTYTVLNASPIVGLTYTDSGLGCGQTYYYRVRATNTSCDGASTLPVAATTTACLTTTVGDGLSVANAAPCPGSGAVVIDDFVVSGATDTITAVQVTMSANSYKALSLIEVVGTTATPTVYGSVANPIADVLSISVSPSIPVTSSQTHYALRITPGTHSMVAGTYAVTARVTGITSGSSHVTSVNDATSATMAIDNLAPQPPPSVTAATADSQITLNWTNPTADFNSVMVLRSTSPITAIPAAGISYALGNSIGGASVVLVSSNATTFVDTSVTNGTSYYYAVFAADSCLNWSGPALSGPYTTHGTLFIGDFLSGGANPPSQTACPGSGPADLDYFTLATSAGPDTVTGLTVTLSSGSAAALSLVEITSNDSATVYGTATIPSSPTSDTITVGTSIAVSPTAVQYRVRVTPRGYALAAGLYAVSGRVTAAQSTVSTATSASDSGSATLTINRQAPAAATWGSNAALDTKVDLAWTAPSGAQVLILRSTSSTATPTDGQSYSVPSTIGASTVILAGAGTGTLSDTGLTNGQDYYYSIFTFDSCHNYSTGVAAGPLRPSPPTTYLADGNDPASIAAPGICPGTQPVFLDAFTLGTNRGTDAVTGITVTLKNGTLPAIALLEIVDNAGNSVGSVANPTSNPVTVPVSLTVGTTPSAFRIRITPKSASAMPPPSAGQSYDVTGTVTSVACSNVLSGSDPASATVTIDNLSPPDPIRTTVVVGDKQITLNWNNQGSPAGVLLVRDLTPITVSPTEGTNYLASQTLGGSAKVVYVGLAGTFTDTQVVNGVAYYYKLFAYDSCGNYSSGSAYDPQTPAASVTTIGNGVDPPDAKLCPGGSAVVIDSFTVKSSRDPDTITAFKVQLKPDGSWQGIGLVQIYSVDTGALVATAINPTGDVISFDPLLANISVPTVGERAYQIRLTPRSHAAMPPPPGATFAITATVSDFTSNSGGKGLNDSSSAALTIDNESPSSPTDAAVVEGTDESVSWLNPTDPDFDGVILVRGALGLPLEGTGYKVGDAIETSTVIYAGTQQQHSEVAAAGTPYRVFARDTCGNYSVAALAKVQPTADAGTAEMHSYDVGGCGCQTGVALAPAAVLLAFGALAVRRNRRRGAGR